MTLPADTAIRVVQLSKAFRIYSRPVDMVLETVSGRARHRPFWALRDVSFEVKRGQVVGILGRNGAGKSTLLKIITGTLDKTSGQVEVNGRVSSILELGTGFSGEFSGRENIYLGGLMMGLSHTEIISKADWIIEFSELEEFIDQPFRTYSSGMQARLTFATAVCIDPDILIIDEALSVGDAHFQRKSFGQIEEFRRAGNTILLVSHDINTINAICDHAILLDRGQIADMGEPQRIGKTYYKMLFAGQDARAGASPEEVADEDSEPLIEIRLDPSRMAPDKGYAWRADISSWDTQGDSPEYPRRSEFVLLEDDAPLRPAHWPHDHIRRYGKGAYSHWGKQLYFSASDNSDPRRNGRNYLLKHRRLLKTEPTPAAAPRTEEREAMRQAALKKLGLGEAHSRGSSRQMRICNGKAEILDYGIWDGQGERVSLLESGRPYTFFFRAVYYEDVEAASAAFLIRNTRGVDMFGVSLHSLGLPVPPRKSGDLAQASLHVTMWLTNGIYFLTISTADPQAATNIQHDSVQDGLQFEVSRKAGIFHASVVDLEASLEISEI